MNMNSLNFIKENYKFCSIKMIKNDTNSEVKNSEAEFYFEDCNQGKILNSSNNNFEFKNGINQNDENNNSYSLMSEEEEKESVSLSNFDMIIYALPSFGKMSCAVMLK